MIPRIHISLVIEEPVVDADLQTKLAMIGANTSWLKGESRAKSLATHSNSGSAFQAGAVDSFSVEDAMTAFWETFHPRAVGALSSLIEEYNLSPILSVVVYIDEITPSIHFESEVIRRMAGLNIGLDVDIITTTL